MSGSIDGALPAALVGTTVYYSSVDTLTVLDPKSGKSAAALRAQNPGVRLSLGGKSPVRAPVVAAVGGRTLVLAHFTVTVPGQGTTAAHDAIEIHALDADTKQEAWNTRIDLAWSSQGSYSPPPVGGLLGVRGTTAVLDDGGGTVYGVDLLSRQVRWNHEGYAAGELTDDAVVVMSGPSSAFNGTCTVTSFDVTDGRQRWTKTISADSPMLVPAGGKVILATVRGRDRVFALVANADGAETPVSGTPTYPDPATTCLYDGRGVTVCTSTRTATGAFAIDTDSGRLLWHLPDDASGRVAPLVTQAWHGAVYGITPNGEVVLDARTGADRNASPGAAPLLVNEHLAIAAPPQNSPDSTGLFAFTPTR